MARLWLWTSGACLAGGSQVAAATARNVEPLAVPSRREHENVDVLWYDTVLLGAELVRVQMLGW